MSVHEKLSKLSQKKHSQNFNEKIEKKQKKESKISKLLLGVIVGGAVGSVVGVTFGDKNRREKIKNTSKKIFGDTKKFMQNQISERKDSKTGFWHILHKIFHGKK